MKRYRRKYSKKEMRVAYLMILPALLGIVIFALVPIVKAFKESFYNYSFYSDPVFVGLKNYKQVWRDRYFWNSLRVGIKYVLIVVPILIVGSFLFANLIVKLRGFIASFVKTAIYVPTVISGVVASMIFMFIYDYQAGILNILLKALGMTGQAWLANPTFALGCVAVPRIWLGFGYTTLFMLGGILDIPGIYYEAARLDGANSLQCMLKITIPSMKNIFIFLFISNIVSTMQEFDLPYNMTGGGPSAVTTTPSLYVYNHFVGDNTIGFSLAAAMMISVVLGALSLLVFKTIKTDKAV